MVKIFKGVPYTGTLPAVLAGTKAGYLNQYKIYGNTEKTGTPTPENPIYPSECGERTENLLNTTGAQSGYITADGTIIRGHANLMYTDYIAIPANIEYLTQSYDNHVAFMDAPSLCFYDNNKTYISGSAFSKATTKTFSIPSNAVYIRTCYRTISYWNMLNSGSTALPYEPYGYKLPLLSGSTHVDIYIGDDTLSTEEYVDYGTQKIYKDVDIWNPNGTTINNQGETQPGNTLVGNIKYSLKNNSAYTFYYRIGASSTSSTAISAGTELSITPSDTLYIWSPVSAGMTNFLAFTKQFVDPPVPFPQIPTTANSTTISWAGSGLAPSEFDSIAEWVSATPKIYTNGAWTDAQTYVHDDGTWVADN